MSEVKRRRRGRVNTGEKRRSREEKREREREREREENAAWWEPRERTGCITREIQAAVHAAYIHTKDENEGRPLITA